MMTNMNQDFIERARTQLSLLLKYEGEYFRKHPFKQLLHRLGLLNDPYMPARLYAAKKAYQELGLTETEAMKTIESAL